VPSKPSSPFVPSCPGGPSINIEYAPTPKPEAAIITAIIANI